MPDRMVHSVTCLGCGCTCDDIAVRVAGDRIVAADRACALGVAWFGDGRAPSRIRVDGQDSPLDAALDAAATLLSTATRPLVYLAPDLSCEAQREAVAIADALGAALDSITSATALPSIIAAQERGRASATLGEIRNRADLLVFWGIDPATRYPRYSTRYAPEPSGVHVTDGRRSRKVVAVDVGDAKGPADADTRIAIRPEDEVAVLTTLTAAVRSIAIPEDDGEPWRTVRALAPVLMQTKYAVIVADGEADESERRDGGRAAALVALGQALNGVTRCAVSTLRGGGNRSGADAVMTWQTGYPCAVDFTHRYPRYRPHDGTAAARLSGGAVDAVLVLGSASRIPAGILEPLAGVRRVVIGPAASDSALAAAGAVIDTGTAGIHEGGTAVRMDDVPLPLRPSLDGPPSTADIIRALRSRVLATQPVRVLS